MSWWEICVTLVIWRTLAVLRRWKRSGHAAHSSQPSSPSSQPTSPRPTSAVLDPDRTVHDSTCTWCHAQAMVPLRDSRLEARPWRLLWRCPVCSAISRVRVHDDLVPAMLQLDRAGGMRVSKREAERFASAADEDWDRALEEELQ